MEDVLSQGERYENVFQSNSVLDIRYLQVGLDVALYLSDGRSSDAFRVYLVSEMISPPFVALISVDGGRLSASVRPFVIQYNSATSVSGVVDLRSVYLGVHLVDARLADVRFSVLVLRARRDAFGNPKVRPGFVLHRVLGSSTFRFFVWGVPYLVFHVEANDSRARCQVNFIDLRLLYRLVEMDGI